jgi:putative drug exporter of the RND superfamily
VRRPWAVLAAWSVAVGLLAMIGLGVEGRLHRLDLVVSGSRSAAASALETREFGDGSNLLVLLEGPPSALDAQGRRVAAQLARRPHTTVVGPWSPGAPRRFRPRPTQATLIVRVARGFEKVAKEDVPDLRRTLHAAVKPPVAAHLSGYADVSNGTYRGSIEALTRAEIIAAPLLMIVLLLVFRSPIAASLPLVLGFATIGASRGVLSMLNGLTELDIATLNLASMMGLALGVDYSLIMVSRFREELRARGETDAEAVAGAVGAARGTAGRTVVFAGLILAGAISTLLFNAPVKLLASATLGVIVAALIAVVGAVTALPALLTLLGPRVDRWTFGRGRATSGWAALADRSTRRPALAAGLVLLMIALLAAPAVGMQTSAPDPRNLPTSSPERRDFIRIATSLAPGWSAPLQIVFASKHGPITDPRRMRALDAFQRRLARTRGVALVLGPAPLTRATTRLDAARRSLAGAGRQIGRARADQDRLARGLARVRSGVGQLRGGLSAASAGADALARGGGDSAAGAGRLREGLVRARAGADQLDAGLGEAAAGAAKLVAGVDPLARGADRLRDGLGTASAGLDDARPQVAQLRSGLRRGSAQLSRLRQPARLTQSKLDEGLADLDAMLPTSKADPRYRRAYEAFSTAYAAISGRRRDNGQTVQPGYDGMDAALASASSRVGDAAGGVATLQAGLGRLGEGLHRLRSGASALVAGIGRLRGGADRLHAGLARLQAGGGSLTGGLGALSAGGDRLQAGLGRLEAGGDRLAGGLSDGSSNAARLEDGAARLYSGVVAARGRTASLARGLGGGAVNSRVFESGYMTLAAVDGSDAATRSTASFAVNLDRGGSAVRLGVVNSGREPSRVGDPLRPRLEHAAAGFARDQGLEYAVGGQALQLQDFDSATKARLLPAMLGLVVVSFALLVMVLRSLVLPLIAVVLNLLSVAAAYGVLTLAFTGASPLLGGSGRIDSIMALTILAIVFGLSIDYEVFLLARLREEYLRRGSTAAALQAAIARTAGVITGAALVMVGVFLAFAVQDLINMRELGIGLTIAVLLDATVIRLVLMPALIRLAGRANWWLPRWLDRVLPRADFDADDPASQSSSPSTDRRCPFGLARGRVA